MFRKTLVLMFAVVWMAGNAFAGEARGPQPKAGSWAVGLMGSAYEVRLDGRSMPVLTEVRTELPAMTYAGRSARGKWIAYTTLAALDSDRPSGRRDIRREEAEAKDGEVVLVPAGDLVVERAGRGGARKIDRADHFVIAAAWSPREDNRIAYTFSTGTDFGVAVADLASGSVSILREGSVLPDSLAWSPDGTGLDIYVEGPVLFKRSTYTVPQVEELRLSVNGGTQKRVGREEAFRLPRVMETLAALWLPNEDAQPFRSELPGGYTVLGDNVLGLTKLFLLDPEGKEVNAVDALRLVATLPSGVLYMESTADALAVRFLSLRGDVSTVVTKAAVTYELPMSSAFNPDLTTTQVGESYSTKCNVSSHTGNLSYAYDFQATAGNEDILAAGAGTVVFTHKAVTCNSADPNGCPDYSSTCSSNGGWGNVIIVSHSDTTYTKYTHLRHGSFTAAVDKIVSRGCKMALEGHTGSTCCNKNGCGDHLHFQRQGGSTQSSASTSISFSDVSNPLSCTTYNTGNPKVTC